MTLPPFDPADPRCMAGYEAAKRQAAGMVRRRMVTVDPTVRRMIESGHAAILAMRPEPQPHTSDSTGEEE